MNELVNNTIAEISNFFFVQVCKRWLEASVKSWLDTQYIAFGDDPDLVWFSSNFFLKFFAIFMQIFSLSTAPFDNSISMQFSAVAASI